MKEKRVTYISKFFRISVTGVKEIRATYISKFFVSGNNMNFCHRGASNKRVTYISKFFVSGRSLNFNIASGLLSGSFSRIALPETVNKPECVILVPLSQVTRKAAQPPVVLSTYTGHKYKAWKYSYS